MENTLKGSIDCQHTYAKANNDLKGNNNHITKYKLRERHHSS